MKHINRVVDVCGVQVPVVAPPQQPLHPEPRIPPQADERGRMARGDRPELLRVQQRHNSAGLRVEVASVVPLHPQHCLAEPLFCGDCGPFPIEERHGIVQPRHIAHLPSHDENHALCHHAKVEQFVLFTKCFGGHGRMAALENCPPVRLVELVEEGMFLHVRHVDFLPHLHQQPLRQHLEAGDIAFQDVSFVAAVAVDERDDAVTELQRNLAVRDELTGKLALLCALPGHAQDVIDNARHIGDECREKAKAQEKDYDGIEPFPEVLRMET
mmetsp:Transcript_7309/g.20244  ORF Transcript_7309/g.20244 Transcript_7309/m.20244 type:complete len:270 (-) Transcript_7309:1137-1946(-)